MNDSDRQQGRGGKSDVNAQRFKPPTLIINWTKLWIAPFLARHEKSSPTVWKSSKFVSSCSEEISEPRRNFMDKTLAIVIVAGIFAVLVNFFFTRS